MTPENRFDKLLAYLQDPSHLSASEISILHQSLGSYEIDTHRQTAIKIMNSGIFSGEDFKQKPGKYGGHYIRNFEQFIARVAAAIDDHSDELESCLDKEIYIRPGLPERLALCIKQFSALEEELSQIKGVNAKKLANMRKTLEKYKVGIIRRLLKMVRGKMPPHLSEKLIDIIKEHSPRITDVLMASVIVKMLAKFELKFTESNIRRKIQRVTHISIK